MASPEIYKLAAEYDRRADRLVEGDAAGSPDGPDVATCVEGLPVGETPGLNRPPSDAAVSSEPSLLRSGSNF